MWERAYRVSAGDNKYFPVVDCFKGGIPKIVLTLYRKLLKIHRGEDIYYLLYCIINIMASDSQGILNRGTNLILSE